MKDIIIKGAREHNLKNIDLVIPRDKLVVFTGLSGSGKSSLAFDTIYAEGQRRYVESLSSYAPTWEQLQQSTMIVLVATLLITGIVWVMDFASSGVLQFVYSLFKQ